MWQSHLHLLLRRSRPWTLSVSIILPRLGQFKLVDNAFQNDGGEERDSMVVLMFPYQFFINEFADFIVHCHSYSSFFLDKLGFTPAMVLC